VFKKLFLAEAEGNFWQRLRAKPNIAPLWTSKAKK
jgi:hypothetical protein